MRKILALIAGGLMVASASSVLAAPAAYYNPINGNIRFTNDSGGVLPAAYVKSAGGNFKLTGLQPINGATADEGDLPTGFTYLNLPTGDSVAGQIANPGLPLAGVVPNQTVPDLTFGYYIGSLTTQPIEIPTLADIPEPASVGLAGMALVGLTVRRRRA